MSRSPWCASRWTKTSCARQLRLLVVVSEGGEATSAIKSLDDVRIDFTNVPDHPVVRKQRGY